VGPLGPAVRYDVITPRTNPLPQPHHFTPPAPSPFLHSQLFLAWFVRDQSWWVVMLIAYTWGGCMNHMMSLALHELSHNLGFRSPVLNRLFSIFVVNLPMGIPAAITFRRYHLEHHRYQGEHLVDTDVPTVAEGHFFKGVILKTLWVLLQPAFYALRPGLTAPKKPGRWEALSWAVQVSFDLLVYRYLGGKALTYLIAGTLLGMGLHPVAGHFIAEHYVFLKGQETYSYYGPLNWLAFNVGYHNEHHDFPFVAGSKLPQLRAMCPEFYDNLPHHSSWPKVRAGGCARDHALASWGLLLADPRPRPPPPPDMRRSSLTTSWTLASGRSRGSSA
jgi:sphingolipid delta-4 desaturase